MSERPPEEVRAQEMTTEPTEHDFHQDMSDGRHSRTARVYEDTIVEHDRTEGQVTVWEAATVHESGVKTYIDPAVEGNTYEWDPMARYESDEDEALFHAFCRLKGGVRVLDFVMTNLVIVPRDEIEARAAASRTDE